MSRRYLITGASGQLGRSLMDRLGGNAVGTDIGDLDITDQDAVHSMVEELDPLWIINCAAVPDVDLCQRDPELARRVNEEGVANLAGTGRRLLTVSTDHVFTGSPSRRKPFAEGDAPEPANAYGRSKLLGERAALEASPKNIVVRTSWMFSRDRGLVPFIWKELSGKKKVMAVCDQISCLTYAPDLAEAMVELTELEEGGIYHRANPPGLTPYDIAMKISLWTGGRVIRIKWSDLGLDAPRPVYSELLTERGTALPPVSDAMERWRKERHV